MTGAIYDLHCHSSASDGILRPEELVSRAKAHQVDVLALTDHDTIAGFAAAKAVADACELRLICGIEFSSQWGKQGIHVVGLNVDPSSNALAAAIVQQQQQREDRAIEIAERLEKLGVSGALEGARALAGTSTIGRPHFAQFLVDNGHVSSADAAFKQYLGAGKVGDVKQGWPDLATVVEWITAAGGVAVLAHPTKYKMTRSKLIAMLNDFKAAGGVGVEVIAGHQPPQATADLARIAERLELLASCGSDFHGPGKPWQELGCFGTLPANCEPIWSAWE